MMARLNDVATAAKRSGLKALKYVRHRHNASCAGGPTLCGNSRCAGCASGGSLEGDITGVIRAAGDVHTWTDVENQRQIQSYD
jgi:hypothetical protein